MSHSLDSEFPHFIDRVLECRSHTVFFTSLGPDSRETCVGKHLTQEETDVRGKVRSYEERLGVGVLFVHSLVWVNRSLTRRNGVRLRFWTKVR